MTEVHSITAAGRSHSDQSRDRMRNYLISMAIRMAAIIAAFLTDGWIRWACVAAAAILPYVAVIMANSGAERRQMPSTYLEDAPATQLTAGPAPGSDDAGRPREAGT